MFGRKKTGMVTADKALPGRMAAIETSTTHFVTGRPIVDKVPTGMAQAMFGMGCFWGVERIFWQLDGVWQSRVGYGAGYSPNPTYEEVCTGQTGHNEVVHLIYEPSQISYEQLLQVFWQGHNPTQGMGQGNDRGTQYRSGIYTYGDTQQARAEASRDIYGARLHKAGLGGITTEILPAGIFFPAEAYHQQYLAKNPTGYCGIGGTGVSCPIGTGIS